MLSNYLTLAQLDDDDDGKEALTMLCYLIQCG